MQQIRKNWKGYLQVVAIIAIIAIALYLARAPDQIEIVDTGPLDDKQLNPVVSVIEPQKTNYNIRLNLTGSVTLKERVTILTELTGRVVWVSPNFEPGGTIDSNEVFIKLDPAEYELAVEEANYDLVAKEIAVEKNKALGEDVSHLEALSSKARVRLQLAKLQLAKTELSLPYEFRVISSSIEVGELAGTAETTGTSSVLGLVYRPESIVVDVPIDIKDVHSLKPIIGRTAIVKTNVGEFNAIVAGMGSIVTPRTRLGSLYLNFDSELDWSEYPLPNTFAEVAIEGPIVENVYVLPEVSEYMLGHVWIVRNGTLMSFAPEIVARDNGYLVVRAFDAGDGIVIDSPANSTDGMTVSTVQIEN